MTPGNEIDTDAPLFSALLTPHRSLPPRGFAILMLALAGISFVAGVSFMLMGAWPVFGFFGLDVLLVWWAFRLNYRHARAYEEILVTPTQLRVRKVGHRGEAAEWVFNPLWVRLGSDEIEDFGMARLFVTARGREFTIAHCLSPGERADFAKALSGALNAARRGPDINPVPAA